MAKSRGLDFGLLMELAGVVLNSTRNKETGKQGQLAVGGFAFDVQKLGWGLAGVAGQQVLRGFQAARENKRIQKMLASGLVTLEDLEQGRLLPGGKAKKESQFGPGLVLGSVVGAVVYVMSMSSEQRQKLFQQIDALVGQAVGFINELQGKPYSQDYEPKSK